MEYSLIFVEIEHPDKQITLADVRGVYGEQPIQFRL